MQLEEIHLSKVPFLLGSMIQTNRTNLNINTARWITYTADRVTILAQVCTYLKRLSVNPFVPVKGVYIMTLPKLNNKISSRCLSKCSVMT